MTGGNVRLTQHHAVSGVAVSGASTPRRELAGVLSVREAGNRPSSEGDQT
jgi:hypothetical protein